MPFRPSISNAPGCPNRATPPNSAVQQPGHHDARADYKAEQKRLSLWAVEGDCEPARLVSNEFTMEWPPKSGAICSFPEADRGEWFDLTEAAKRILKGQQAILGRLAELAN